MSAVSPALSATGGEKVILLFTTEDEPGALDSILQVFRNQRLSLRHIESRPSQSLAWQYDFMVEFYLASPPELAKLTAALEPLCKGLQVVSSLPHASSVPWFPRRLTDLDVFAERTLQFGAELDADHPGFRDQAYRNRRAQIVAISRQYRT